MLCGRRSRPTYIQQKMVITMLEHLLATLASLIVVLVTFLGGFGARHLGKARPPAPSLAVGLIYPKNKNTTK